MNVIRHATPFEQLDPALLTPCHHPPGFFSSILDEEEAPGPIECDSGILDRVFAAPR
jgi:hypothetical protein